MREKGTASYSGNFEVQKAAPLDARGLTATVADLILATTWTANDGLIYAFKGLTTTVSSDPTPSNNGIWWLSALPYSDPTNWKQIAGSTGGATIVADTYANIKALKDANSLVAEGIYIITDYQTKYTQLGTSLLKTGTIEPLRLIASSINSFYEDVKSPLFPKDEIKYDFLGTTNYQTEPTPLVADKGVITWRKDANCNSADYDHKNIFWERDSSDVLTFTFGSYNNTFISDSSNPSFNNVIGSNSVNNIFGAGAANNTTRSGCKSNIFGVDFKDNFIESNCENNEFGINNHHNTIGAYFNGNKTEQNFHTNTIGTGSSANIFGLSFYGNIVGDNFQTNKTGIGCSGNVFGTDCTNNILKNYCTNNKFGNLFILNILESGIRNIDWTTATPTHVYGEYYCRIFDGVSDNNVTQPILEYFSTSMYAMQYVDPLS